MLVPFLVVLSCCLIVVGFGAETSPANQQAQELPAGLRGPWTATAVVIVVDGQPNQVRHIVPHQIATASAHRVQITGLVQSSIGRITSGTRLVRGYPVDLWRIDIEDAERFLCLVQDRRWPNRAVLQERRTDTGALGRVWVIVFDQPENVPVVFPHERDESAQPTTSRPDELSLAGVGVFPRRRDETWLSAS